MPIQVSSASAKRMCKKVGVDAPAAAPRRRGSRPRVGDADYDPEYLLKIFLDAAHKLGYKIPPFTKEYQFAKEYKKRFKFDICWPRKGLAIEFDGNAHKSHYRWSSDAVKSWWAGALGWRVMHVTETQMLDDPTAFLECLEMALNS